MSLLLIHLFFCVKHRHMFILVDYNRSTPKQPFPVKARKFR